MGERVGAEHVCIGREGLLRSYMHAAVNDAGAVLQAQLQGCPCGTMRQTHCFKPAQAEGSPVVAQHLIRSIPRHLHKPAGMQGKGGVSPQHGRHVSEPALASCSRKPAYSPFACIYQRAVREGGICHYKCMA
jgi:hypothetical protein